MNSFGKYKLLLLTLCLFVMPLLSNASDSLNFNDTLLNKSTHLLSDSPVKVILIDPGHGGKDIGCQSNHLNEKEIALEISKSLADIIKDSHPEIEIRLTRTEDEFVPLHQRVDHANEEDVDIFISIHCNALSDSQAHGFETYVMGLHTSQENFKIALRENSVIEMEDLTGFDSDDDPYATELHIMAAMTQQQNLEKSIQLAGFTQSAIDEHTEFRNRGVKQAGFVVLRKVVVPSILIEAGFISNPGDAKILKDSEQKNAIAYSIAEGIRNYIQYYSSN